MGKKLGSANFGQVFLVEHKVTNCALAVKRMANDDRNCDGHVKKGLMERYGEETDGENPVSEIGASSYVSIVCTNNYQLQHHPNILRMAGVWMDDLWTYFATEACVRGELFGIVAERKRLPMDLTRCYMRQIVSAIGYLHSRGLGHR